MQEGAGEVGRAGVDGKGWDGPEGVVPAGGDWWNRRWIREWKGRSGKGSRWMGKGVSWGVLVLTRSNRCKRGGGEGEDPKEGGRT